MSKKIECYFSAIETATATAAATTTATATAAGTALPWDVSLAHNILRSCHTLFRELERIQLGVMDGTTAVSVCGTEWTATEAHVDDMLAVLQSTQEKREARRLVRASRQTIGSMRVCVQTLAASTELQAASASAVQATVMALSAAAAQIHMNEAREEKGEAQAQPNPSVADAVRAAGSLAEQLRIFTRVSQQSWAATRSQLAHAPSIPSPLALGSAPQHRRWVSEDIETETDSTPNTFAGTPEPLHSRNRSDSRLQIGNAVLPRTKQVRFLARTPPSAEPAPAIDQAHLADFALALSAFEKAVAALAEERGDIGPHTPAVRALVTAFVQLSRLASSTGMVRHFDRPALALFKTTTQAVKLLMPQKS
ncbi:hypothetical protein BX661DRAFT_170391 [Kickxella alabastrina]|uniref:uncharacterized protein n=1 Tax=Kickxella alabastrina TaxID=61397 RepID=UPI00221FF57D|nr:uncharacterized protein BX661DRAFT_170391 [Kickxella alabastrina]KAI7830054.1 hypothetical protein BX661DRAFT_170391 [Kickxella alabastrina]